MGKVAKDQQDASLDLPVPAKPVHLRSTSTGTLIHGLPVAEVLGVSTLAGARVLAGAGGLGRVVQRLNVMEVPDILPWVKENELLLTTGYPLRHEPETLAGLVGALAERRLAALGIKLGRYIDALPEAMLSEADRLDFPIIQLPDDVGFDDILNQVLTDVLNRQAAALARAEEVHRALIQIVLGGGGLDEVTEELVGLLDGPVLVTSPDGRVLARAGRDEGGLAEQVHPCFDATGRFRTEHARTGVQRHDGFAGNHAVVPIMAGGLDHGRIVAISENGTLDDNAVHVLERAATVAALAITKELAVSAVESKYRGDFLRDMVTGRSGGRERIIAHSASLGWNVDRPLVVVVAELDPDSEPLPREGLPMRPGQERFAAAWTSVIRARDAKAPVGGFSQEVLALLGLPRDGDVDRLVRDIVAELAGDGGGGRRSFSTGVSRIATSVQMLPEAYEQARRAVGIGRKVQGNGAVAHFERLGVFRLLSLVPDSGELQGFVRETLGELGERDDAETADLRRTLQTLLDTNLNVAETARVLHFHYNTLRYRIGKLERLLGPFTTDPHLRLNLQLALQVQQMRGL